MVHNGCEFKIVRYYNDRAVIRIKPLCGAFTNGEEEIFVDEKIENLTTNLGGGFEEWVKDNY
jgi:hypothetical protein